MFGGGFSSAAGMPLSYATMELAGGCSEMMSVGGGEVLTKIVTWSGSSRSRELVVLCGAGDKKALRINKALRMGRQGQQQQQAWQRLILRSAALASGKEDVQAEPPLPFEPSLEQHHKEDWDAAALVKELQEVFASRRTRSVEWREEQLKGIARMMTERVDELVEALRQDLNKPMLETYVSEIIQEKEEVETELN